jgi:beta-lactam-binding protein with PASTA domain
MTRPRSARLLLAAALLLTGGLVCVVSVPTLGGAPPTAQLPSLTHRSPERAEARIPRNLLGHPLDQVRTTLAEAGFTRVVARPAAGSTGGELGTVTAVDPGEGRTVPVTSAVILTYVTWTKPSPSRGSDTARSSAASHSPDSPARNADQPTPRRSGRQDPAATKAPPGQSSPPPGHSAARGNSSAEKHRHRPASRKKAPNTSSEKRRN